MEDRRKLSWVKWNKCCSSKQKGGLGIKNIETFNHALVGKWLWRLLNENEALWVRVLDSKYGGREEWMKEGGSKKGSIWWKDLLAIGDVNNNDGWWWKRIKRKADSGTSVLFWVDKWLGFVILKEKHNRIYCNSSQHGELISNMGRWEEGEWRWDFKWRRPWFEWERVLLTEFLQELENVKPERDTDDGWTWTGEKCL